jgi:hypothetical protein
MSQELLAAATKRVQELQMKLHGGEFDEYRLDLCLVASACAALLATAPQSSPWQPIETAPKTPDGEAAVAVILGFAPDEEGFSPSTCEGFWNPPLGRWCSTLDPGWKDSPQPTHWMALPASPQEPEAGA